MWPLVFGFQVAAHAPCKHVSAHVHTRGHMRAHTYARANTDAHTHYTRANADAHTHIRTCDHECAHTHIHTHLRTCKHGCMHTQDNIRGATASTPGTYDSALTPKAYTPSMYGGLNEPHHAPTPSWHEHEGPQTGMMAAGRCLYCVCLRMCSCVCLCLFMCACACACACNCLHMHADIRVLVTS